MPTTFLVVVSVLIVSLVINYFPTAFGVTGRKIVLIVGIVGAVLAFVQGYGNLERANDLQKQLSEARAAEQEIKERILQRKITDEKRQTIVNSVRQFEGQKVNIMTIWDNLECASFADDLITTLRLANWEAERTGEVFFRSGSLHRPPPFIFPQNGIVIVNVNSPPERTQNAAKALVDALNQAKIQAEEQYVPTERSLDEISIQIGTRRAPETAILFLPRCHPAHLASVNRSVTAASRLYSFIAPRSARSGWDRCS